MRISGFWVALTVLAVLTVGCGQPAQEEKAAEPPAPPTAEEAVEVLVQAWDSAMNAGDAAAAAALYVSDNPAIMPPEMPAREGGEALRAHFASEFESGPVTVKNWKKGIVEGKRLVMAHGGYALTVPGEGDEPEEVNGKWICIAERRDDGSLAAVRNIWNVDAPPEGAPEMYPLNATGPAAAEETPCHATPTALDQAFRDDLVAGNVAAIAASHAEDAIRMAPGRPALEGRQAISDYTQSFMETFSDRELELTGIDEQVDGNVGYTWGSFRYTYTPSSGDDKVQDEGKYVSVATQDANGCWQTQWVLWNSNTPWTTE